MLYGILVDFAVAALLIVLSQWIRARVTWVQRYFLPSSLIAGFIGLALGPYFLNVLPFTENIGSYAGLLTVVVFAAVGMAGFHKGSGGWRAEIARLGSYFCYKTLALTLQVCIPVAFSILVISRLYPEINYGFGLLLVAGFNGGHGTAAAVGNSFVRIGFPEAMDLGMTIATVGILAGVFGGLIFIKWATSRGYTEYIRDFRYISGDLRTGLIPKEQREELGDRTISNIALDPLAWHLALVLVPSGAGYLLNKWIFATTAIDLPTFTVAFLLALALFLILRRVGVYEYVDTRVFDRISGTTTDFLVFFGVASIKVPVVMEYAGPLALLLLCGILVVWATMRYGGPLLNKESWFERSIFVFGYATGVFAIGFVLLRIVDPAYRSKTITDTAIVGPINTPLEIFTWSAAPFMLLNGQHWWLVGIYVVISAGLLLVCRVSGWWWQSLPLTGRGDASEV